MVYLVGLAVALTALAAGGVVAGLGVIARDLGLNRARRLPIRAAEARFLPRDIRDLNRAFSRIESAHLRGMRDDG